MSTAMFAPAVGSGVTLVVFSVVFIPLPVISVVLRLWARRLSHKGLEFNDYAIIVGGILAVVNTGVTIGAVFNGGVGRHLDDIMRDYPLLFAPLMKMTLTLAITWTLANTAVKLSILHLYYVIFVNPKFRWGCFVVMGLTAAYCFSNILQNLLLCRPIQYNWDKTIDGHCSPSYYPYVSSASINMGLDVIIFLLPIPMLWRLQMDSRRKIYLCLIFGVGILICALSAVRIDAIATMNYDDFSYSVVADGIYSVLEPCLGVANACLPLLRPVILRLTTGRTAGSPPPQFDTSGHRDAFRTNISAGKHFKRIPDELNNSQDSETYPLRVTTKFEMETHSVKESSELV